MKRQIVAVGLAFFVGTLFIMSYLPGAAEAIPSFSRQYGAKCTVCHLQFPKLKEHGIAFKNRGYRKEDEKGEFIWDGKAFPVGAFARVQYINKEEREPGSVVREGKVEFDELEAFAAGTLAPRISFFVDGIFAGGEKPFIQFDDILPDSALNLKAGVYNVDNYFLSNPRRLTRTKYLAQTTSDREDTVTFVNEGVEVNGQFIDQGFRYVLGVGNDNTEGSDHAFGNHFFALINQNILGHTVSLVYRRDRAGNSIDNRTPPDTVDDTHTIGGSVEFNLFRKLIVDAAVYQFYGGDSLAYSVNGNPRDYEVTSGTAEAIYQFTNQWLALARYDWHDTNDSPAFEEQYVGSIQYHPIANVKINLEYSNKDVNAPAPGSTLLIDPKQEEIIRLNVAFGF